MAKEDKLGKRRIVMTSAQKGVDSKGNVIDFIVKGPKTDELKVAEQNSNLLQTVVNLLRVGVHQRNEAYDLELTVDDNEEKDG